MKTILRVFTVCLALLAFAPLAFADVVWTPMDEAAMYARMYALPVLLVVTVVSVSAVLLWRMMKKRKK